LFTLSEAIGVSPWYWWADVPPAKHAALYVSLPEASFHDAPAVKYRGIFINDEDWGLNVWAKETFDPKFGNIGPKTYEKVFELLLRLRMNYIWPAMHKCSTEFGSVPENAALADKYAIVAGSSHCEPMLYNNVKWDEKTKGHWDYVANRDVIHNTWEEASKARGNYEAVWTLGIRGIHDAQMEGSKDIPTRIRTVSEVIKDQRALLDQYVSKQWGPIAQAFVPYKEVLTIYDRGLQVPPDVTLVWVDDNFGYIRRFSNPDERKRPGGSGVYYHISYYGGPHSYTWINTTAPALIWEEMHKAWDNEARTLWVVNVGDIKPMEIGLDYWSRLAWNPPAFGADSQPRFLKAYVGRTFGEPARQPIVELLTEFYRLGTIHKPEEMNRAWAMSLTAYEAETLEKDYQVLLAREESVAQSVPPEARDAYTELVGFPARVLGQTGLIFMADRKMQLGQEVVANQHYITSLRSALEAGVQNYNTQVAGGKWNHFMPGLVTGKELGAWSSQVRWPWGEKASAAADSQPSNQLPAGQQWRDAATANRQSAQGEARWIEVPGLGPSGHAMSLQFWSEGSANAPRLEYDFSAKGGDGEALIDFLPTFRIYPGMKLRVAVSVDEQSPTLVEIPGSSGTEDERGPVRNAAVQDNYVRLDVPLAGLSAGKHVFRIAAVDPGAVVDRVSLPLP
jgi:hypothetical protein